MPGFNRRTSILVLGSFPSERSLAAGEYYAHPQNKFWTILSGVCGEPCPENYHVKKAFLARHNICLWDVIGSCIREGSADQMIKDPVINPIDKIIAGNPSIKAVFINGQRAGALFRTAYPDLDKKVHVEILPSTSPANAGMTVAEKSARWKAMLRFLK